jgi:ABC-type uncharacterized transport system substrate-binding protein
MLMAAMQRSNSVGRKDIKISCRMAADLVRRQVGVIIAGSTPAAFAAKAAPSTIPIVIIVGIDPVQLGLVGSLNRSGGNVTGLAILTGEFAAKKVEVLHVLLSRSSRHRYAGQSDDPPYRARNES